MTTPTRATIQDLYHVPENGKAELVNGEIICVSPTGVAPGYAGGEIFASLREYARRTKTGFAFPDNVGFVVNLPGRRSFSPDAAFYVGKWTGAKFAEGAPVFAVEVRSEEDYGPQAERKMAAKRADYFAAGTLTVWDVDVLQASVVRKYTPADPANPVIFRRGEIADAEPAVPGWTMPVDDLFIKIYQETPAFTRGRNGPESIPRKSPGQAGCSISLPSAGEFSFPFSPKILAVRLSAFTTYQVV